MRWFLAIAVILVLFLLVFSIVSYRSQKSQRAPVIPSVTPPPRESGMVASAHPIATKIGVEILRKGGNAVDAAVATAFALGVAEPFASGIGGGGFMLIYIAKTKEVVTIDYREMAPLQARPNMYLTPQGQLREDLMEEGHTSVAVPGTVAGLSLALRRYGTMDAKSVMEPSIEVAQNGYAVGKLLNSMMQNNAQKLSKFPAAAQIYLKNGKPYEVGARFYLTDLANTYRLIAEKGPDVFYRGTIAEAIEKEMKKSGTGLITKEDLAAYHPVLRPPVHGSYRGYETFSMGPPSSGGAHVIELLNIFEGYDIARLGLNTPESISFMADAMARVFLDRTRFMGDPDFVKIPLDRLISKEYAAQLRMNLGRERGSAKGVSKDRVVDALHQTSHLSVVDKAGNLVALTQTLNSFFGSGVVIPGTGILLNNEMNDFVPQPGSLNSIAPRKRPLSSMSPTLVLKDGRPYLTIGMPGATRIITVLPQILMNMIDRKMDIQEAINAPRFHCMADKQIFVESRIPQAVQDGLTRMGYTVIVKDAFDLYFGGAQGVMIDPQTGSLRGGADPRREGSVMAYGG